MNETSWQQEREMSKARHADFWMYLHREAEMMNDDEIEDEREMTLEEKNRLREILGYGLSAALPLAYHPEDDDATIARLTAQLDAMTKRKDSWRLIALASLRECYAQWVGAEPRDTADYWHEFYLMNSEIRRKMEDVLAGVPIWKVRND